MSLIFNQWEPTNQLRWVVRGYSTSQDFILQQHGYHFEPVDVLVHGQSVKTVWSWRDVPVYHGEAE